MFDANVLQDVAKKFKDKLVLLAEVEDILNDRFYGMEDAIRALILAVASGEALLYIGLPGTGKSRLIRALCHLIGVSNLEGAPDKSIDSSKYFEYLITPYTEPNELFGYFNIAKLHEDGVLERLDKYAMQKAEVVYLDEFFNGSSAILNSLLSFLNERIFHDRGKIEEVNMKLLFAATNNIPEQPELRAVYDRFVLRCWVDNAEAEDLGWLLQKGLNETYGKIDDPPSEFINLHTELEAMRSTVKSTLATGFKQSGNRGKQKEMFTTFVQIVGGARQYTLSEMSNRRIIRIIYIMVIHRLYEAVRNGDLGKPIFLRPEENTLISKYFLDRQDTELQTKLNNL